MATRWAVYWKLGNSSEKCYRASSLTVNEKMNDIKNVFQKVFYTEIFQNYWIENSARRQSIQDSILVPRMSLVQAVEGIQPTALPSIFGSKVPTWFEFVEPTPQEKFMFGGRALPNQWLVSFTRTWQNYQEWSQFANICACLPRYC